MWLDWRGTLIYEDDLSPVEVEATLQALRKETEAAAKPVRASLKRKGRKRATPAALTEAETQLLEEAAFYEDLDAGRRFAARGRSPTPSHLPIYPPTSPPSMSCPALPCPA